MTTPAPLTSYTLRRHPYENPIPDQGVMEGAADGWLSGRFAILFHTTTETRAAAILRDGFRPSPALEVGGFRTLGPEYPAGRMTRPGIWASIRPTVPNDSDAWMPDVCGESWAVLQMVADLKVIPRRVVLEPTWPVVQFCLEPADVLGVTLLPPEQMPRLMHPETALKIASFRADYHLPSLYLDALDAAAAIASAGVAR